jgi:hypothetical protein
MLGNDCPRTFESISEERNLVRKCRVAQEVAQQIVGGEPSLTIAAEHALLWIRVKGVFFIVKGFENTDDGLVRVRPKSRVTPFSDRKYELRICASVRGGYSKRFRRIGVEWAIGLSRRCQSILCRLLILAGKQCEQA